MPPVKTDQRKEAGLRTRARLLDAALDLLAERGEDGLTLRELTDAAEANVAAVSYHFGSLKSLCDAAIDHALERYLDDQQEALDALGDQVQHGIQEPGLGPQAGLATLVHSRRIHALIQSDA